MTTRLLLLTMVKNESRIIERLMNSVKGKVDAIVVCDTGSTDNTIELAHKWLQTNQMPGAVYEFPFVNFGKSRTKSFHSAQDWVSKQEGWDASKTWALLLDGDMMLSESQTVSKENLAKVTETIAGISLKQANGSLVYSNMRVLRCSEPWICKGATHEAWTCPDGKATALFESPVLVDHNDGGCKADKYPRDVRLLLEDLAEMPNDARTHFYLGQTYLCMRDFEKAIPILKKRIEIGGWDEEVYIAECYLGDSLMATGKEGEAINVWLNAFQRRQHRTEAAMRVITHYRNKSKSQFLAMMVLEKLFAQQFGEQLRTGERVGASANNQDILFVNKRDVDYHIWEEMGILAFYTGTQKPVWLRTDELDLANTLPWHEFNNLFSQMHWYDPVLRPRRKVRFALPVERTPWAEEEHASVWQPFNPSLRVKGDKSGYELNLRYANYFTLEAKHYAYRGFDGKVLTRNCLTFVPSDAGWNAPTKIEEIKVDEKHKQNDHSVRGIEDCRLIQNSSREEFLGTSMSYSNNGTNKIFHVTREAGETTWTLKQMPLPPGVSPQECQKNWMGFRWSGGQRAGKLHYIYSFTPFRICDEEGAYVVNQEFTGRLRPREYRGSAGPVAWKSTARPSERYLCVMHKVYIGGDGRRYYHRFMTLDEDMRPSRISCWVRMTRERVEYWSGMCQNIEGDGYWITYGVKDSEGYIAEMRTEDIENKLFYDVKSGETIPFNTRLHVLEGF